MKKTITQKPILYKDVAPIIEDAFEYEIGISQFINCCGIDEVGAFPENKPDSYRIDAIVSEYNRIFKGARLSEKQTLEFFMMWVEKFLFASMKNTMIVTLLIKEQAYIIDILKNMKKPKGECIWRDVKSNNTRNPLVFFMFIPQKNIHIEKAKK